MLFVCTSGQLKCPNIILYILYYIILYYIKDHHHCHHTVQVTILRPTTTAITSTTTAPVTMHAFSICATALGKKQTTSASYCGLGPAPAPFRPPHVPRSTCAQWWKIRTTSASYRGSKTTLPPLACTMQQAHVSLHKGMPLNWGYGQKFNGMPLCKLQVLAASCTPMVAV